MISGFNENFNFVNKKWKIELVLLSQKCEDDYNCLLPLGRESRLRLPAGEVSCIL
jgi:hypothetical protein